MLFPRSIISISSSISSSIPSSISSSLTSISRRRRRRLACTNTCSRSLRVVSVSVGNRAGSATSAISSTSRTFTTNNNHTRATTKRAAHHVVSFHERHQPSLAMMMMMMMMPSPFSVYMTRTGTSTTSSTALRSMSSSTSRPSNKNSKGGGGGGGRSDGGGGSKNKRSGGGRHFAHRKNEIERLAEAKREKKRDKKRQKALLLSSSSSSSQSTSSNVPSQGVPPALLVPTGSPHAYIARMALVDNNMDDDDDDEDDEDEDDDNDDDADLDTSSMSPSNSNPSTVKASSLIIGQQQQYQAQSLFRNYQQVPRLFETHQFDHVNPQSLNMEYPTHGRTEVAFLGRSNVGKSSLVNALMRRNLCKTSKSPGRTQLPYYYGLFSKKLIAEKEKAKSTTSTSSSTSSTIIHPSHVTGYLVDLPGYGFGAAPKQVVEGWQAQTQEWLLDRRDAGVLKRLFLLLDARRGQDGPSKLDETVIQWAEEAEIPFSIVLTKADRVSVPLVIKQVNDLCIRYSTRTSQARQGSGVATFQSPIVHITSASNHWGINELLESIEAEFLGLDDDDEEEEEEETEESI